MGHHPLEVALQRHLLHQRPAAMGIRQEGERAGEHPALPAQTLGSFQGHGTLQHHRSTGAAQLQHRPLGQILLNPARRPQPIGQGGIRRPPHLPVPGVGNHRRHACLPPAGSRLLRALVAGEGTQHLAAQAQGGIEGLLTPVQLELGGLVAGAIGGDQGHHPRCGGELQRRGRPQAGGQGHPEHRLARIHPGGFADGPVQGVRWGQARHQGRGGLTASRQQHRQHAGHPHQTGMERRQRRKEGQGQGTGLPQS